MDLNVNSAMEDARHHQELFIPVMVYDVGEPHSSGARVVMDVPRPGDLLCYPTFRLAGHSQPWIGHVAIVTSVPAEWDWEYDTWRELTVVQCRGPNGRRPAIAETSGNGWEVHDLTWPKPEHRSQLIRVKT